MFYGAQPIHVASRDGFLDIVKLLVENGANINETNCVGRTPIYVASMRGNFEIVQFLVENKCNVNAKDKDGINATNLAKIIERKDIYDYLVEHGGVEGDIKGMALDKSSFDKHEVIESRFKFGVV